MISEKIKRQMVHLYIQDKLSMFQIAEKLNVSVSGVSYHLEKNDIQRRSISDAITCLHTTKFGKKSFLIKKHLSACDKELKIAGIMLYLGEGAKSGNTVKFVNSDPAVIKIFLNFLREVCGIHEERLKALIHLYPDHDKNELHEFWSKNTKIPKNRFYKPFIHVGKAGTYKHKSLYGTLALNYSDKRLLKTILEWINDYEHKAGVAQR